MIDALITGRLVADPKPGSSRNGNPYATARVLVSANAEERLHVPVIAFKASAVTALLATCLGATLGATRLPR